MKKKSTDVKLPVESQEFVDKWYNYLIRNNWSPESKMKMESELIVIMKECFVWGGISKATKTSDKSMQFSFEEWVKTSS